MASMKRKGSVSTDHEMVSVPKAMLIDAVSTYEALVGVVEAFHHLEREFGMVNSSGAVVVVHKCPGCSICVTLIPTARKLIARVRKVLT